MSKRSIVYVDGFNLYYGALRGSRNKWLNLEDFFVRLRQDDKVENILYFTARVIGPARPKQDAYLSALSTMPLVRVILGKFKTKAVRCTVPTCSHSGERNFNVPEEKRTDVNIAVSMLDDAYQGRMDRIVLVSGDSDLAPSLLRIADRFPDIERIVYVPATNELRGAAVELRQAAHKDKTLPLALLKHCQFPDQVALPGGRIVNKPIAW